MALHRFFSDPWVLASLALMAAILINMQQRPAIPAQVDWSFHRYCVDLAHSIVNYGSRPRQSYFDAGCPIGTWNGVICGWIADAECDRLLIEWNAPHPEAR